MGSNDPAPASAELIQVWKVGLLELAGESFEAGENRLRVVIDRLAAVSVLLRDPLDSAVEAPIAEDFRCDLPLAEPLLGQVKHTPALFRR